MAPISRSLDLDVLARVMAPAPASASAHLANRALGTPLDRMQIVPVVPPPQQHIIQILALAFSIASVASAILAFYWFVKMRRSFRHDLIMLLIQSDMFKALWFMIYPIVTFIQGPVADLSTFCKVNGFFVSLGIEASDWAILMIAVHTALYIFKPSTSAGEGGLYPYRKIAYVLWVIFPLLMAGLAFINERDSYTTSEGGAYCYLPVRPYWYRIGLSWIPRYVIFTVILSIYASIYGYVSYKFRNFSKEGSSQSDHSLKGDQNGTENKPSKPWKRYSLPQSPTTPAQRLDSNATLVNPRQRTGSDFSFGAHPSMSLTFQTQTGLDNATLSDVESPDVITPALRQPIEGQTTNNRNLGPDFPAAAFLQSRDPSQDSSIQNIESEASQQSVTPLRKNSIFESFPRRFSIRSIPTVIQPLSTIDTTSTLVNHYRTGSTPPADTPTNLTNLQLVNTQGQDFAVAEMLATRDKIHRQLRFLFIYPLVYVAMWILPFVYHVMQFTDRYVENPSFPLNILVTIFICSQAAVDCWLFSTREKPWKYMPGHDGSFLGSLKFWTGWEGKEKKHMIHVSRVHGPGKTREEMVREARAAYRRRDEEMAQRRQDSLGLHSAEAGPEAAVPKKQRTWWDMATYDGILGSMSPVEEEELSNPLDSILEADPYPEPSRPGTAERQQQDEDLQPQKENIERGRHEEKGAEVTKQEEGEETAEQVEMSEKVADKEGAVEALERGDGNEEETGEEKEESEETIDEKRRPEGENGNDL
ncbi:G protein-coupled glucose receptor regulating Gpa2-domain-containing protein [Xylogone sp. PMI_703]|nr:G protein-coupled glucose receptor regulating Gpa2-domain-containing protein [Xylogone sp. PMI_703]